MTQISLAFVDDHPIFLSGMVAVFSSDPSFTVLAHGTTAKDAQDIVREQKPDVIVMDLNMPGRVLETIAEIACSGTSTRILAFTAANTIDTAIAALEAGASGYVLKGAPAGEVIEAIFSIQRGETFITPSFAGKVIAGLRTASLRRAAAQAIRLSLREEQVLRLLLRGGTNKEIANSLDISDKTVKHYMTRLIQKLNVRNRIEVVLAAQQMEMSRPQRGAQLLI
jgi:two-component system nitrate/nitrite response regulator NarL